MEDAPKKGMSKGCLILLIVGGAVLVLGLGALATCWFYKDDLLKTGVVTLVNSLKTQLAEKEDEEVDTVQFNAMADAFVEKLQAEEPLNLESYSTFASSVQQVMKDDTFDGGEVTLIQDAMVQYFPELESMIPPEVVDTPITEDSLVTE